MFKLTIFMAHEPSGWAEFKRHYLDIHLPLARDLPGLLRDEVTVFAHDHDGDRDPMLMAELYFADEDVWRAAMNTPQGERLSADADTFPPATQFKGMRLGRVVAAR